MPKLRWFVLSLVVIIGLQQIHGWWSLVVPTTDQPSSEEIAGEIAKSQRLPVYYNAINWPAMVFYANQQILDTGLMRDAFGYLTVKISQTKNPALLIVARSDQAKFEQLDSRIKFLSFAGDYSILQLVPK